MTTRRIRIIEESPSQPICPHCEKDVDAIAARRVESALGVRFLYYCPQCRKILGISHRKGFWMG
jgi:uncharacterized protein with PIN domain